MADVGDKFPNFKLLDHQGNTVSLADYKDKRVVFFFYPKDHTPGCTKEACGFRDHYNTLKRRGFEIIGVSKDSPSSHESFKQKHDLPFPLLSDPEQSLAKALGFFGTKTMYGKKVEGLIRSTAVVNKGKIERIYRNVKAAVHPDQVLKDFGNEP